MDIDDNNNSKKKKFLFLGSLIVAFMFGTMLIIPVFTRETPLLQRETGIQSNILTGEISENQTWENEYGRLTVYPKTSNNIVTQTQYANVLWKYPDNNIDIAFRFNDSLSGSDIWMWQNISHDVSIPDYDWITTNYTLWNITDFQLIDEPESVMFGDIPSDYYANGNCSMWMGDFYEPLGFIDIGFDEFNWLDDEHTVCELTYTYWGVVGYHTEQQNWMDWNSKKSSFHHTVYNGKHYYYVKDVPVKQDRVYNFKWQYDIPIHSSGKWDLLAKLSSDTIQEALSSGRYIMLDPWWSSSWTYYKTITVDKDYIDADLVNFPVLVNSTDTAMIAKCDGGDSIRFLAGHNSGGTENNTEFYYEIEEWTPGGFSIWVNVSLIHNDVDTQLLLYYNNSAASDNQNPSAVWDDNYVCVHHMNDTSAWNSKKGDSGTPQNNVAVNGSGISKIGKCLWFDGAGDEVKFGWFAYMDMDLMTVESWSKKLTANTANPAICSIGWEHWINQLTWAQNKINYNVWNNTKVSATVAATFSDVTDWFYGTLSRNSSHIISYSDGDLDASTAHPDGIYFFDKGLTIGSYESTSNWWDGWIDEVRVSRIARNDSWIKACFHTQDQTTGFLTFGEEIEEAVVGETWQPISFDINGTGFNTTAFKPVSYSINGTGYNVTSWNAIDFSINGSGYNITAFKPVSYSINGTGYNITVFTPIDFSINGTGYNATLETWTSINFSINGTGFNITVLQPIDYTINGTGFNVSVPGWTPIDFSINGTGFNTTGAPIIQISNPYPSNRSINIPRQPVAYVTVIHRNGTAFNVTWYYGLSQGSENTLFGTDNNQNNGTITELFFIASNRSTNYYWRVMVEDGSNYVNDSFYFTTEGYDANIQSDGGLGIGIVGVIGLLGLVFYLVKRRRDKNA